MPSSDIEMRSPAVSSMSSSRGSGTSAIWAAIASSSSVVCPIALTTTITSLPASRVRTTRSATAAIRSTDPTEVPPNFITTMGMPVGTPAREPHESSRG